MGRVDCSPQLVQHASCLDQSLVFFISAEKSQDDVIHGCPEHRALALDMESPSAIWILSSEEIASNLCGDVRWNRCFGDIPGDYQAWEEEQRAAVLACPIARWKL